MCFVKDAPTIPQSEPVVQHEADASLTKSNKDQKLSSGFKQNIKTTAFGLEEAPNTTKKTLLGE